MQHHCAWRNVRALQNAGRTYPFICFFFLFLFILFGTGCQTLKEVPKYQLTEGFYTSRLYHKKLKKVYIVPTDDTIKIYSAKGLAKEHPDTLAALKIAFPAHNKPAAFENYVFSKNSFDVDVLSVLFKYRPSVSGFPRQFNTAFNGVVYLGYRSDLYRLSYRQTPLRIFRRFITHYGYSVGGFTGFGTERIDEYVTNNNLSIQYDGLVNLSGIAIIVGVDKLTFGLTAGTDHLLDKNHSVWLYQHKPWFGISIGLNLN